MIDGFKCLRCGNCCRWPGYVRLAAGEALSIAGFLGIGEIAFNDKYTILTDDRRSLSLTEKEDGSCVFFAEEPPRCLIEAVKPLQCRNFPFEWNFANWDDECAGGRALKEKRSGM